MTSNSMRSRYEIKLDLTPFNKDEGNVEILKYIADKLEIECNYEIKNIGIDIEIIATDEEFENLCSLMLDELRQKYRHYYTIVKKPLDVEQETNENLQGQSS